MGTRSNWSGFWVVGVTLGLAACGGKYSVGSGDDPAQAGDAGAGNAGDDDSGGSSANGGGSGGTAGGSSSGGVSSGGVSSGGVAGAAVGGAAAGGSAGVYTCLVSEGSLPAFERAAPEVVWERLSVFLHGEPLEPLLPLPETATNDWVREALRVLLDRRTLDELGTIPGGLVAFMNAWAFESGEEASAALWVDRMTRPRATLADLFERPLENSPDYEVSFLTDRGFLTAHPNSTRRGVWMASNLACVSIPLPPPDIGTDPVTVPPSSTRRQTIEAMVSHDVCAGCHSVFDPFGFSLENFDELGEYRTTENGLPIDASGSVDVNGLAATFASIADLAPQIGVSCTAAQCFAAKLFEHTIARVRPENPGIDSIQLAYVQNRFVEGHGAFLPLFDAIATTPSFLSE